MNSIEKPQVNCISLSFDIEDWYHTASISGASISKYSTLNDFLQKSEHSRVDCITEATIRILDILKSYDVKATFFVVADVASRYSDITKLLRSSMHEIASHSLCHQSAIDSYSKKPLRSVQEWTYDQIRAKKTLEDLFGREVIGFRAPNAYFANWMVEPLSEIGFKYDSSIAYNSFYNKTNVKLRNVPTFPYRLNSTTLGCENPDVNLVEIPWSYYRLFPSIILPAGGAFFFRLCGYGYFRRTLNQALQKGDTMFYLHSLDISSKDIPESNSKSRPAYWINKGKSTETKLIRLIQTFRERLCKCQEVYYRFVEENRCITSK